MGLSWILILAEYFTEVHLTFPLVFAVGPFYSHPLPHTYTENKQTNKQTKQNTKKTTNFERNCLAFYIKMCLTTGHRPLLVHCASSPPGSLDRKKQEQKGCLCHRQGWQRARLSRSRQPALYELTSAGYFGVSASYQGKQAQEEGYANTTELLLTP